MAEAFSVPHTAVCLSTAAARTASPAVPPVFELEVEKRRRRLVNVDDKEQQQQRPRKRQQRAPDSSHTAGGLSLPGLLERRMALVAERDCDVWRVFGRQEDALQTLNSLTLHSHCTTPSSTLHLFSHELSGSSGAREFIVSSYAAFYRRYMALPARHRHHYELIMYRQPCHLYLDVEFQRKHNLHISCEQHEDQLMRLLVDRVLLELVLQYGVSASVCDVVHLDSSSDAKFSRHVIVRLPHAVFVDNEHVGGFVRHLVDCIVTEAVEDDDMRRLMLWSRSQPSTAIAERCLDDGVPAPPIDCGVYSKHRSFRLLWSSKRKPNAPVLHCHHTQQYNRAVSQRAMWLHSCVQYMEPHSRDNAHSQRALLTWPPRAVDDSNEQHRQDSDDSSSHHTSVSCGTHSSTGTEDGCNRAQPLSHLRCPPSATCCCMSRAASRRNRESTEANCALRSLLHWPALSLLAHFLSDPDTWPADPAAASVALRSHSVVRASGYVAEGDCEGDVYRVTLLYSVTGSRYCARVGRSHRSNGIYLVCNLYIHHTAAPLDTASMLAVCQSPPPPPPPWPTGRLVQRCHDIDCKGFSSTPIALPAELMRRLSAVSAVLV